MKAETLGVGVGGIASQPSRRAERKPREGMSCEERKRGRSQGNMQQATMGDSCDSTYKGIEAG